MESQTGNDWSLSGVGDYAGDDPTTAFGWAAGRIKIRLGFIIAPGFYSEIRAWKQRRLAENGGLEVELEPEDVLVHIGPSRVKGGHGEVPL